MSNTEQPFTRQILWSSAVYFAACGISAIAYPASWLFVSGLPTTVSTELSLAFGVVGAYLLAFAFGSGISALAPGKHPGLILTLVVGNIFDFCVTLKAVVAQELPILNGGLFIAVTVAWAVLLGLVYVSVKRTAH
jgi:hypothetical protein